MFYIRKSIVCNHGHTLSFIPFPYRLNADGGALVWAMRLRAAPEGWLEPQDRKSQTSVTMGRVTIPALDLLLAGCYRRKINFIFYNLLF